MHRHELPSFICCPFIIHLTCLIYTHMALFSLSRSYIIFALWDLCHQMGGILNKRTKGNWQHHGNISLHYFTFNRNVEEMNRWDPSCLRAASAWRCSPATRLKHKRRQTKLTSEGRFHGGLHHPDKQLKTLGVLGKAGGECCQGVGMTTQILQGNPLTKVGLD